MAKLHMRCSIELDVPDKVFKEIVDRQLQEYGQVTETEYWELPLLVQQMINTKNFEPCDWDDGGYVPQEWLEFDAEESGLYNVDEHGVRRKENA
jgi:hypothetical protein